MVKATYLLTGDVGGTNSRMALYDTQSSCSDGKPLVQKEFKNEKHLPKEVRGDPEAFKKHIVIPFLEHCWKEADLVHLSECQIIACMATAGIVSNNRVNMTNLGNLLVDGNDIKDDNKNEYLQRISVCRIVNDFVAQGYGCLTLKSSEVIQLYGPKNAKVEDLKEGVKVCVGAGTGLGECFLTSDNDGNYSCFPSEGGHVEYAPRNDLEIKLWKFLNHKFVSKDRVSVERVVSGIGLANVYDFLAHEYPERIIKSVHDEFLTAKDEQGKVVSVNAKEGTLCLDAISIMMGAYGCEVGSAAIKWIPTGGLFVTGGLTPKNIHFINDYKSEFMLAYLNKGRVSPALERIPLYAVMVEDLGVRGAHKAALMEYQRFLESGHKRHIKHAKVGRIIQDYCWTAMAVTAVASFAAGIAFHRVRR